MQLTCKDEHAEGSSIGCWVMGERVTWLASIICCSSSSSWKEVPSSSIGTALPCAMLRCALAAM